MRPRRFVTVRYLPHIDMRPVPRPVSSANKARRARRQTQCASTAQAITCASVPLDMKEILKSAAWTSMNVSTRHAITRAPTRPADTAALVMPVISQRVISVRTSTNVIHLVVATTPHAQILCPDLAARALLATREARILTLRRRSNASKSMSVLHLKATHAMSTPTVPILMAPFRALVTLDMPETALFAPTRTSATPRHALPILRAQTLKEDILVTA